MRLAQSILDAVPSNRLSPRLGLLGVWEENFGKCTATHIKILEQSSKPQPALRLCNLSRQLNLERIVHW